jgi:TolB-like protein
MGQVYLAHDTKHERRVAVKVLDPVYARMVGTQRFVREIRIAAMLTHPNIVPLYDSGEFDGQLFYVMPYVEGQSLRDRLKRDLMLPLGQTIEWAAEIADALAYAHTHGIVHRDIKPENLLVQGDRLVLADFGVARAIDLAAGEDITSEQLVVGTPLYMSPEQAGGAKVDGRSDIYSLGCVIYEMLVGEPPFTGATPQAVTAKKASGHYPPMRVVRPTVPSTVDETVARALASIPADRFETAQDFGAALRASASSSRRLRVPPLAFLGVLAIAAVLVGLHMTRPRPLGTLRQRVVVAVFANRTGDPSKDALGIMAADWITEGLQRTGEVDVVPTLTALTADRYLHSASDSADPVRTMARETGANLVVTGTIYQDSDSLIVQAQLVNPVAGRLVGAVDPVRTSVNRPTDALQELRTRLMGLLALSLDTRVLQTERPPTFAAYQAFSEGLDAYAGESYQVALQSFRRAQGADSSFLLASLYASFCLTNLHQYAQADSALRLIAGRRERLSDYDRYWLDYERGELAGNDIEALQAIRRAAELAPTSKATYNLAVVAFEGRQPFTAESALARLSPDIGAMRGWQPYWALWASALHAQRKYRQEARAGREGRRRFPGRVEAYLPEARAHAAEQETAELERLWTSVVNLRDARAPDVGNLALEIGDELTAHGDKDASRQWFERAYKLVSADGATAVTARWVRARAAARLGRWKEALGLGESLVADDPGQRDYYLGFMGIASAALGDKSGAQELSRRLADDQRPFTFGEPQVQAARIAAVLGDSAQVASLLDAAHRKGYPYDLEFHRDPAFTSVRDLTAVQQLDVAPQ